MKQGNSAIAHLATARTTLSVTYKLLRQMTELLLPRPC
jgi:hypothetical protein